MSHRPERQKGMRFKQEKGMTARNIRVYPLSNSQFRHLFRVLFCTQKASLSSGLSGLVECRFMTKHFGVYRGSKSNEIITTTECGIKHH